MPRNKYATNADRVRLSSAEDASGCWTWQRTIHREGYGQVKIAGRTLLAHRFSYETFIGPIADGLQIDHLCRNRACVNPEHLEPVTPQDNIHRSPVAPGALNARKTQCPKGHAYDESNTYYAPSCGRLCRTCQRNRRTDAALRAAGIEVAA